MERFWSKVEKGSPEECWIWTAARNGDGYGRFSVNGQIVGAHVFSFLLAGGKLTEENPWVLHTCDNPPCVNPAHLFGGNSLTNVQDCMEKGRAKMGTYERGPDWCSNLAKLTPEQVLEIRELAAAGELTQKQIGQQFGITEHAVGLIHLRKRWAHLA